MLHWLIEEICAYIDARLLVTERRINMATLKDVKNAEDRIGTGIARAIAQNAANVKAIADAIADQADPSEVEALAAEAQAHADAMDAAFPIHVDDTPTAAPTTPPVPAPPAA